MNEQKTCHQINEMISGLVDNELTQQERQRVMLHIDACDTCKQHYETLCELKTAIKEAPMPTMEAEKIDAILNEPVTKLTQYIAWTAILIAISFSAIFTAVMFLGSSDISTTQKVITSLFWGGLIGVFLSVLRQQWLARKTDKYKGVKL